MAHSSLQGRIEAEAFVDGTPMLAQDNAVDILDAPSGQRDRQLLLGETFNVLDTKDNYHFGYAQSDGYVGWVSTVFLKPGAPRTHRVAVSRSIGIDTRDVKKPGNPWVLPLGAQIRVSRFEGDWAMAHLRTPHVGVSKWVRRDHLVPLDHVESDPVGVAGRLVGTPYLWGGNSAFGIDCSGLVQIACRACDIACPGDSDQQAAQLGETMPEQTPLQRGDLLFWKGHVAWVSDPNTILHANAHAMAVSFEDARQAIQRIDAAGDGPVTRHARLTA
ncbi:C40 family peptidase [Roseobacteraceae bacterium S113]